MVQVNSCIFKSCFGRIFDEFDRVSGAFIPRLAFQPVREDSSSVLGTFFEEFGLVASSCCRLRNSEPLNRPEDVPEQPPGNRNLCHLKDDSA